MVLCLWALRRQDVLAPLLGAALPVPSLPSPAPPASPTEEELPSEAVHGELQLASGEPAPAGTLVFLTLLSTWEASRVNFDEIGLCRVGCVDLDALHAQCACEGRGPWPMARSNGWYVPPAEATAATNSDGSFGFALVPPGTYALWAVPENQAPAITRVTVREDLQTAPLLRCNAMADVGGTVMDVETEVPIPNATLLVANAAWPLFRPALASKDGTFRATGLASGSLHIHARDGAYRTLETTYSSLPDMDVHVRHSAVLEGDVLQDGAKVPGVEVVLWRVQGNADQQRRTTTDTNGHYRFHGVQRGVQEVRTEHGEAAAHARVKTTPGDTIQVDLDLISRFQVEVDVSTGWGTPVEGAEVMLKGCVRPSGEPDQTAAGTATTGDGGVAVVWVDDRGTCLWLASHEEHGAVTMTAPVAPNVRVSLVFPKTAPLRGRVLNEAGEGLEAWVRVERGPVGWKGTLFPDGRFTIPHLKPGAWPLWVQVDGFLPQTSHIVLDLEHPAAEITVVMKDRGMTLTARVLDPQGNRVQAAAVVVHETGAGELRAVDAKPMGDGTFAASGLRECHACVHVVEACLVGSGLGDVCARSTARAFQGANHFTLVPDASTADESAALPEDVFDGVEPDPQAAEHAR